MNITLQVHGVNFQGSEDRRPSTHRAEPGGEPPHDVEPVQDVDGVPEAGVDRGLVRHRSVGDDDLDALTPSSPLGDQESVQRLAVAVRDHRQHLAGLAVLEHGAVAVT